MTGSFGRVPALSRRQLLRLSAAGVLGASASGWIEAMAASAAADPRRRKSCILLWMTGGPSQIDTFERVFNEMFGAGPPGPQRPMPPRVPGRSVHAPGAVCRSGR